MVGLGTNFCHDAIFSPLQCHGGTNFGRTTSFVMTRYYDEAPLDEFGEISNSLDPGFF